MKIYLIVIKFWDGYHIVYQNGTIIGNDVIEHLSKYWAYEQFMVNNDGCVVTNIIEL